MKKWSSKIGVVVFWLSWPLLYFYLKGSHRTRLLLVSGNLVLLLKSWHGLGEWSLPGGGLHKGEDRVKGALRELKEETGLELKAAQIKPLISDVYRDRGLSFMAHYFIVQLPEPLAVHARLPEIMTAEWLDYRKLDKTSLGADTTTALKAWAASDLLQ